MGINNKITEHEINRMLILSETMNPVQIAKELGRSVGIVQGRLREKGAPELKWCPRCEQNRALEDFDSAHRNRCMRHELHKATYAQDAQQVEAEGFIRAAAPLEALWRATPGDFRNHWVESYSAQ